MVAQNRRMPIHTNASVVNRLISPASDDVTKLDAIVEGMIKSGIGVRQYEAAMNTSLKLPSPSNSVVRHQLATTKSIKGTITPMICTQIVE